MTVPAHGKVTVPFTLHVPEGAEPGDHPGALVALDERIDKGDGSLALGVQRAVGARVYLRVGGPALPAIAVENVHVVHHQPLVPGLGDKQGDDLVHPAQHRQRHPRTESELRAEGLFGRTLLARELSRIPSELLPGQRVKLTEPWQGAPQLDWGDITLTASAAHTRDSRSASFFALPWLVAVVLLVVVVVGVVLVVRARRGRARPSEPVRRSRPAAPTPSRPRSSPSARL